MIQAWLLNQRQKLVRSENQEPMTAKEVDPDDVQPKLKKAKKSNKNPKSRKHEKYT